MKLYTFKICPFVERAQIVAKECGMDCEQIEVDIRNKPQWYLDLPEASTVPKLEMTIEKNHKAYIPDTIAICNLFDDLNGNTLQPSDLKVKAFNTYWIHQLTPLMGNAYMMSMADNQNDHENYKAALFSQLHHLEILLSNIQPNPYFNGETYKMIDIAYAPQFKRFECMARLYQLDLLSDFPFIQKWSDSTLAIPSVAACLNNPTFNDNYKELVVLRNSYMQFQKDI